MTRLSAAKQFITDTLEGDATTVEKGPGGVHASARPQGEKRTAYVFDHLGGEDVTDGSGDIGASPLEFLIRAVADGTSFPEEAASALHAALHRKSAEVGPYEIDCFQRAEWERAFREDGEEQRQRGGRYLVLVRPLEGAGEG